MKSVLIFVLASVAALAIQDGNSRIAGGSQAGPNEFPFVVGVLISQQETHGFCGGILLSPTHVLTSANCVIRQTSLTVLLGSSDITRAEQIIPVIHIRLHWNHSTVVVSRADLAILTLARAARLGDAVSIAQLPRWSHVGNSFNGFGVTLVGWGTTGHRQDEMAPVQHLQLTRTPVISNFVCGFSHLFVTDEHICTSGDNGGPCSGDEGGPVMITESGQHTVIAIHSFHYGGIGGCERGRSAVHTRLTEHLDWLQQHTGVEIRP
ncbi:brachyurin-like [Toxorhynchites rutilus septentrionalis]|uniref:brachyurin-like n=1 Tax=Toxorhynchites rutilus septentrionalis TaxID=329112 RepID=UPI0024793AF5|nr:brachyurin-like [Toxorhynchites rutilus septentrionalis]